MQRWIRVVVIGLLVGPLSFGQATACGRLGRSRQAGRVVWAEPPGCAVAAGCDGSWGAQNVAVGGGLEAGEWPVDWHAMDGCHVVDDDACDGTPGCDAVDHDAVDHEASCCAAGVADRMVDEVMVPAAAVAAWPALPGPAVIGEPTVAEPLPGADVVATLPDPPAPAAAEPPLESAPQAVRHPESRLVAGPQPPVAEEPVDAARDDAVDAVEPPAAAEPPVATTVPGAPAEGNLFDELVPDPASRFDERSAAEPAPRAETPPAAPAGEEGARRPGRGGAASLVASGPRESLRLWTDASGRRAIVGTLVGVVGDAVEIRRAGGGILTVPIDGLSDVDRLHARAVGRRLATAATGRTAVR